MYSTAYATPFDSLFAEIARTRAHYESLRVGDGSLEDRAIALSQLHKLRADMAVLRRSI
jgi:hypothetical protein